MADPAEFETTLRRQRHYGRLHFIYPPLWWRERVLEWLVPILWALMPIVAIVALIWAGGRGQ